MNVEYEITEIKKELDAIHELEMSVVRALESLAKEVEELKDKK